MGTASFDDTEGHPDGPLPTELLADTLGHQPAVIAAYPMPDPVVNGVIRYAVVCDHQMPTPRVELRGVVHALETQCLKIVDLFLFAPSNAPSLPRSGAYVGAQGFSCDGKGYDPPSEHDPLNGSKLRTIERYADASSERPGLDVALLRWMEESEHYFHNDARREYEDDWHAYFRLYPPALRRAFLTSRSSHLMEICASSPILMFRSRWEQHA